LGFATGHEKLPVEKRRSLNDLLKELAMPRPGWLLNQNEKRIIDALASMMNESRWASGKKLRTFLKMERDGFQYNIRRLAPRCLQPDGEQGGDTYTLTLVGLLSSAEDARVARVIEAALATLKQSFDKDPDVAGFTLDEVLGAGQF